MRRQVLKNKMRTGNLSKDLRRSLAVRSPHNKIYDECCEIHQRTYSTCGSQDLEKHIAEITICPVLCSWSVSSVEACAVARTPPVKTSVRRDVTARGRWWHGYPCPRSSTTRTCGADANDACANRAFTNHSRLQFRFLFAKIQLQRWRDVANVANRFGDPAARRPQQHTIPYRHRRQT